MCDDGGVADRPDTPRVGRRRNVLEHASACEVDCDEPRLEVGGSEHDEPMLDRGERSQLMWGEHDGGAHGEELAPVHAVTTAARLRQVPEGNHDGPRSGRTRRCPILRSF